MIYEEFGLNTYRWFSSTVLRFDNYMEDAIIFCNVDIIDELKEIIDNGGMLNLKRAIHNSSNLFISVNFDNYDVLNIFI